MRVERQRRVSGKVGRATLRGAVRVTGTDSLATTLACGGESVNLDCGSPLPLWGASIADGGWSGVTSHPQRREVEPQIKHRLTQIRKATEEGKGGRLFWGGLFPGRLGVLPFAPLFPKNLRQSVFNLRLTPSGGATLRGAVRGWSRDASFRCNANGSVEPRPTKGQSVRLRRQTGDGPAVHPYPFRLKSATHSTCWVCGNMSTGWTSTSS